MFKEVKEMIDSTIYTNGRGEVTAQNVNLAMRGVINVTEEAFDEVNKSVADSNTKIIKIEQDITNLSNNTSSGLFLKFPMVLFYLLEMNVLEDVFIDSESVKLIIDEFPTLAQPLEELINHNADIIYKINDLYAKEKSIPSVGIDVTALMKEISELAEERSFNTPVEIFTPSYIAFCGAYELTAICCVEKVMYPFVFGSNYFGLVSLYSPHDIYIPRPTDGQIETSLDALTILNMQYPDSGLLIENNYYLGKIEDSSDSKIAIVPVYAKKSDIGNILFLRFVVDSELLEAVINLKSGKTTSRVIATMTSEEVDVVAEGAISRSRNLAYPYYDILPAEGEAFVSLEIESNVPWILYDGETFLTSGSEGRNSYDYVVGPNLLTEPIYHNYVVEAPEQQNEIIATLTIKQEAAEKQITEE